MSNEIIPSTPGVRLDAKGAQISSYADEDDLKVLLKKVSIAKSATSFITGDIVNEFIRRGKGIAEIAQELGLSHSDLKKAGVTCHAIPYDERSKQLDFFYHEEVAKLPEADRKDALSKAEQEEWELRRLRLSSRLGRIATDDDVANDKRKEGTDNVHPHVTSLVGHLSRMEKDGFLDSMDQEEILITVENLMPVFQKAFAYIEKINDPDVLAGLNELFEGEPLRPVTVTITEGDR